MRVLVVNAGSSSLKLRLLDDGDQLLRGADVTVGAGGIDTGELARVLTGWPAPDSVGHRIVHGGALFTGAALITAEVREQLAALTDLAPLHQPKSLAALDAVSHQLPDVPAVACFDTAFHAGIPIAAATYPVPLEWRTRYGIRRFGFHGLSHAYCTHRAAMIAGLAEPDLRVVSCHLGAGASLAAVVGGQSVDTTMGFTPLDGLVMATRSGSLDPGLVLWLEEHEHLSPHEISLALETRSGMLALAGTADMREVESAAAAGHDDAALALEVYLHRLAAGVAGMCAALGGLDILAFTGGVGENSIVVRAGLADRLAFLGVGIDDAANASTGDRDVSSAGSPVRSVVIAAREDLQIARETRLLLGS